jgi:2-polyprenyl-3-methyl-5-hydroxy-6-metoxy-1,4-benzoquinol methylase
MCGFHYDTFHVLRSDLEKRRQRCHPLVQEIQSLGTEQVSVCNVCQSQEKTIIATQDRYGMQTRLALCMQCGLIYQLDPLFLSGFNAFYASHYRIIEKLYSGEPLTQAYIPTALRSGQEAYARKLLYLLDGHLPLNEQSSVLDVGGNIGVIAQQVQQQFGCKVVVIDPAEPEIKIAKSQGIEAHLTTLEAWETTDSFDFIMILRSIEHFYDLHRALVKVKQLLAPAGLVYLDFTDLSLLTRYIGPIHAVAKLEHKFWLTQYTARTVLSHLGYDVVFSHLTEGYSGQGLLLRVVDSEKEPQKADPKALQRIILDIQQNHILWDQVSSKPGLWQMLRAEIRRLRSR